MTNRMKKEQKTNNQLVLEANEGKLSGTRVSTSLKGFSGSGYVTGLDEDNNFLEVKGFISCDSNIDLFIRYAALNGVRRNILYINDDCYGEFITEQSNNFVELKICNLSLKQGPVKIKVVKGWGGIEVDSFLLKPSPERSSESPDFQLSNPFASKECHTILGYLKNIYGKKIITGQHTAAASGPELDHIKEITGKLPALRGFDFLSYSLKTDTVEATPHKIEEINENKGSTEKAIEWGNLHKGLVTFCWHWYAPTGGKDKAFYTENTDFDLNKALIPDSTEYKALLADMDEIAKQLKRLRDENIPVFWRPLHEADGGWFWWGAKGPEPYKKLYVWMYKRFTEYHQLNNLIWVWNAPNTDWYPGDDYVDISGVDTYAPSGEYGPLKCHFDYCQELIQNRKPIALTENGPIPDPEKLIESKTPWLWYMPWYGEFVFGNSTSEYQLKKAYDHPYCITLDDLPNR
ncbi:glycosyl hydrolase [Saliterribacillus persicus]|uniref:Mannan endo-1,4-beta-mannosidase n=1 Tax=Saliterribacillus persicus TaxID=930114 RepID=A0A368YFC4_9BACI|nr:glycosyl hydrolase [Saliterribacillus persicus]RCW76884.1 mannan endo-1,4-beta-mannosidase [Saliterribacillus persicus]